GQTNTFNDDVDEAPVKDLALNEDNIFQADQCDDFDSNVDEAPTTKTMFMENLSSVDPIYVEADPSYDSDILSEYVKDNTVQVVQRQFYDSDLEVAFKKHLCYVRDVDGVELLKGSRGSNLYTIFVKDMMKSSPIYLLSKASKNKSWLWHHRLNHLNFGTINDLARKDLLRGLPRLKFEKYHLCSTCQLGKSKN
nr:integrase, catalytic region, zinc finger, CCHC-type, peptidase aspartic, catalytic [Tanacetum cinerariifolium]